MYTQQGQFEQRDRKLELVHRTRNTRYSVAFLVQGPCEPDDFDCLLNMKRQWDRRQGESAVAVASEPARPSSPLLARPKSWYEFLNTALDVDSPGIPILVNSTPFSITFSFEGLEEGRILSYELQLKCLDDRATLDGGDTGVRLSDRVQFDAQSTTLAVRVTPEGRWIVTAGSLEVDFCYSLQRRGLAAGGVTAWS